MAKKKPLAVKTKKPKPFAWWHHTPDETRAIQLLIDAFGKLTYCRDGFPKVRMWPGIGRRCPECDTRYTPETWPQCDWCRGSDPREIVLRWLHKQRQETALESM